jgi:hypothetical protein
MPTGGDEPRNDQTGAVIRCQVAGEGLFTRELCRPLARRGITIPLVEHDLVAEMRGQQPTLDRINPMRAG